MSEMTGGPAVAASPVGKLAELTTLFDEKLRALDAEQSGWDDRLQAVAADPMVELDGGPNCEEIATLRKARLQEVGLTALAWYRAGARAAVEGRDLAHPAPHGARAAGSLAGQIPRRPPPVEVVVSSLHDGQTATWSSGGAERAPTRHPAMAIERLIEVMARVGPPPAPVSTPAEVEAELDRLADAAESTHFWIDVPREAQRALVGTVVARARHVQDESPGIPGHRRDDLDRVFSAMTGYSKREQPGFVFGLMRTHTPINGTWSGDAVMWWDRLAVHLPDAAASPDRALAVLRSAIDEGAEPDVLTAHAVLALDAGVESEDGRLVRMMAPYREALGKVARFKKLRKAIRGFEESDEAFAAELLAPLEVPADWAHGDAVRDRNVVVLSGDVPAEGRKYLEAAFGFGHMEWVTKEHPRLLQSLAEGVRQGGVDAIIVMRRFIGPEVDRILVPACRAASVPWISVEGAYGVAQIREAIDAAMLADAAAHG